MGNVEGLDVSTNLEKLAVTGRYLLTKIIRLDRGMNQKIAGKDSFYQKEK